MSPGISAHTLALLREKDSLDMAPRTPAAAKSAKIHSAHNTPGSDGTNDSLDLGSLGITSVQIMPATPFAGVASARKAHPQSAMRGQDEVDKDPETQFTEATPAAVALPTMTTTTLIEPATMEAPLTGQDPFALVTEEQYATLPSYIETVLPLRDLNIAIETVKVRCT